MSVDDDSRLEPRCYRDRKSKVLIPGCYSVIAGHSCSCAPRASVETRKTIERVLAILAGEGLLMGGGGGVVAQSAVARAVDKIKALQFAEPRRRPPTP